MKLTLAIQVRVPGSSQPKLDQGSVSCKKTQIRFLFDLKISALLSSSSESAYFKCLMVINEKPLGTECGVE